MKARDKSLLPSLPKQEDMQKRYQRRVVEMHIKTTSGMDITLHLLDTQVVDMCNGMTFIYGKSYDIF
jgi:hypothetical protein